MTRREWLSLRFLDTCRIHRRHIYDRRHLSNFQGGGDFHVGPNAPPICPLSIYRTFFREREKGTARNSREYLLLTTNIKIRKLATHRIHGDLFGTLLHVSIEEQQKILILVEKNLACFSVRFFFLLLCLERINHDIIIFVSGESLRNYKFWRWSPDRRRKLLASSSSQKLKIFTIFFFSSYIHWSVYILYMYRLVREWWSFPDGRRPTPRKNGRKKEEEKKTNYFFSHPFFRLSWVGHDAWQHTRLQMRWRERREKIDSLFWLECKKKSYKWAGQAFSTPDRLRTE